MGRSGSTSDRAARALALALAAGPGALPGAFLVGTLAPGSAAAQSRTTQSRTTHFHVLPGALGDALRQYGQASGRPLIFTEALVAGRQTKGIHGYLTDEAALERLLAGSGLAYRRTGAGVLLIIPLPAGKRLARSLAAPDPKPPASPPPSDTPTELDSVVITALKRPQAARQVPMSLSITDVGLGAPGSLGLSDVLYGTPGTAWNASALGLSTVAIRGITTTLGTDRGQSATGYFIDEVSLTDPYFAQGAFDLDTFDLDNVTVLRGPQTTIYGASAFAGAVNYQTTKPNLDRLEGRVQASAASAGHDGPRPSARAMLNLPIRPGVLALRATYVHREDGGFVDNTGIGVSDANNAVTRSGRVQLAWRPTTDLRLGFMHLAQSQKTADMGYEDSATPKTKDTQRAEGIDVHTTLSVLRLDQDLPVGGLTIVASRRDGRRWLDASPSSAASYSADRRDLINTVSKALEVRLASSAERPLSFLLGSAFEDSRSRLATTTAQFYLGQRTDFDETYAYRARNGAVFGEITYRPSAHWRIDLNGRFSRIAERGLGVVTQTVAGSDRQTVSTPVRSTARSATPRLAVSWSPDDRTTLYAAVATGARYGGPNFNPDRQIWNTPVSFGRDSLISKEAGVRTRIFDRRLQMEASVFHIDWRDAQVRLITPLFGYSYAANAKRATSMGLEWSGTWSVTDNLLLRANLTYLDARLRDPAYAGLSQTGGPLTLPGASRWRTAEEVSYRWNRLPMTPQLTLSHRFASRAASVIGGGLEQGDYHVVDSRLIFSGRTVEIGLFANNITDAKGVTLSGGVMRFVEPPRRIGVSIDRRF